MRRALSLGLLLALASPAIPVMAQMQGVRDDARVFGTAATTAAQGTADTEQTPIDNLPGYQGANAPERSYENNPGALEAARIGAARTNSGAILVIDGNAIRPVVPTAQVDETVARGEIINQNPATYARGVDPQGTTGQCVELPPSTSSAGTFEATCNSGSKIVDEVRSCAPALVPTTVDQTFYDYWVSDDRFGPNGVPVMSGFAAMIQSGQCTALPEYLPVCDTQIVYGAGGSDPQAYLHFCRNVVRGNAQRYTCAAQVPTPFAGNQPFPAVATGQLYFATQTRSTTTMARDDGVCSALATDPNCSFTGPEVCTDSSPQTRDMGGTLITQPCWAWKRDYQCKTITRGNDCTDLHNNPACRFDRTECLDDPRAGACKVEERIYTCPIPASATDPKQFVCGGDVYCIGGDCEAVTRETSDEFKDAVVGMESLAQANREFSDIDFKLFKGTAMSCHKPIFGLVNCCAGKTSGLIPVATGFAALAAGPAAIAGLATPFLTLFLCGPKEMELDVRDRMGLCHTLGSWCSESFLGICTTKRRSSCCFLSKLTRILQEQGRDQLRKSWGTPKTPDCAGFTIDEFAALDLSKMDFTEVYKEFMDAAKVPNEAAAMTDIQAKIRAYYARRGP